MNKEVMFTSTLEECTQSIYDGDILLAKSVGKGPQEKWKKNYDLCHLGGAMPNSLRNIYSQDIPKGRPGTFQPYVLQCFIFAFSPQNCAPYAYI